MVAFIDGIEVHYQVFDGEEDTREVQGVAARIEISKMLIDGIDLEEYILSSDDDDEKASLQELADRIEDFIQ